MESITLLMTTTNDDGTESEELVEAFVINTPEELDRLFANLEEDARVETQIANMKDAARVEGKLADKLADLGWNTSEVN